MTLDVPNEEVFLKRKQYFKVTFITFSQDHDLIVYDGAANSKTNDFGMKTEDGDAEGLLPHQPHKLTSHTVKQEAGSEASEDKHSTTATGKRKVQMPRTLEREYWLTKRTKNSTIPNDNKLK